MPAPTIEDMRLANVNPRTGLATDYLNLFNEAIMLFELAIDMPDLAADLEGWSNRTYVEHFEHSAFARRDIVIAAYYAAPTDIKARFDGLCEQTCERFSQAICALMASDLSRESDRARAGFELAELKHLVALLDAEIHGHAPSLSDGHLEAGGEIDQAAIDALF